MILISHRGLLNGPDVERENTVDAINECLRLGFDVEVDVWYRDGWYLGHDEPKTPTTLDFLSTKGLWIHAKNLYAAEKLYGSNLTYFYHDKEPRVLTSNGYWWTYPQKKVGYKSIALMPEWYTNVEKCIEWNCAGVCTDFVTKLQNDAVQ